MLYLRFKALLVYTLTKVLVLYNSGLNQRYQRLRPLINC